MAAHRMRHRGPGLCLSALLLFSCGGKQQAVLFPVRGNGAELVAFSRAAAEGALDFAKPQKLEYRFEPPPAFPGPASLEIAYDFSVPPGEEISGRCQLVLAIAGGGAWALPMDLAFLGRAPFTVESVPAILSYAIPIGDSFSGQFSLSLAPVDPDAKQRVPRREQLPLFQIRSMEIKERWFGYYRDSAGGAERFCTSPYVFSPEQGEQVIDPPLSGELTGVLPELWAGLLPGREAAARTGERRFEVFPRAGELHLPGGSFAANAGPLILSGDRIESFRLFYAAPPPFPGPIAADPGVILSWPEEHWRDRRYELFRWEQFPSLLIFDIADYATQDRLLKRLAFFTEKAGFRGRLAPDAEIAGLHGWNAHDYRAADLARFFEAARLSNFPLLSEERELERILFDNGIIRRAANGEISAGEGGIISISRESTAYLRSLFMVHEGFHGLFFIDEDFRAFSRQRWDRLGAAAKRFMLSYFDYQHYDIKDEYLMINEFMAHVLQQPVSQAGRYFGQTLPVRIEASPWRRAVLPAKDPAAGSWPALAAAFTTEAEAFSAYVNQRWGLAAGRVWQVISRPAP